MLVIGAVWQSRDYYTDNHNLRRYVCTTSTCNGVVLCSAGGGVDLIAVLAVKVALLVKVDLEAESGAA